MRVYAQVVGLATGDSSPSVLVVTDTGRYLFNVGEGLQRMCMEHKLRMVKVDGLFFTAVNADTCGGVPGMLLTLADMGRCALNVYGGPGLCDYVVGWRHFMRRSDVTVHAREVPPWCIPSNGDGLDGPKTGHARGGGGLHPVVRPDLTVIPVVLSAPRRPERVAAIAQHAAALTAVMRQPVHAASARGLVTPPSPPPPPAMPGGPTAVPPMPTPAAPAPAGGKRPSTLGSGGKKGKGAGGGCEEVGDAHGQHVDMWLPFNPLRLSWWPTSSSSVDDLLPATPIPHVVSTLSLAAEGVDAAPLTSTTGPSCPPSLAASLCYIVSTPPIAGKFHPDKAAGYGVKSGPAFGRLSRGESVQVPMLRREAVRRGLLPVPNAPPAAPAGVAVATSSADDGGDDTVLVMVHTTDVKDPDTPGQVMAIVDVPDAAFLPSLLRAREFDRYQVASVAGSGGDATNTAIATTSSPSSSPPHTPLRVMFHYSPAHVAGLPEYVAWMNRFGGDVNHVFLRGSPPSPTATKFVTAPVPAPPTFSGAPTHVPDLATMWGQPTPSSVGTTAWLSSTLSGVPPPAYHPPIMFRSQAMQYVKLHLLDPITFTLPHPLAAGVAAVMTNAMEADGPASAEAGAVPLSPLQRWVLRTIRAKAAGLPVPIPEAPAAGASSSGAGSCARAHGEAVVAEHGGSPRPGTMPAMPLLQYVLAPLTQAGWDLSAVPRALTPVEPLSEILADAAMVAHLQTTLTAGNTPIHPPASTPAIADGPRVTWSTAADGTGGGGLPSTLSLVFTGTSSAIPSKYRNVSGIYVQLPPVVGGGVPGAVVMDCGEGTYGQLARRFGESVCPSASGAVGSPPATPVTAEALPRCVEDALLRVQMVWISHMHADHHLGLLKLLRERHQLRTAGAWTAHAGARHPVLVVGPTRLYTWLMEASAVDDHLVGEWRFVDAEHFLHACTSPQAVLDEGVEGDSVPEQRDSVPTSAGMDGAGTKRTAVMAFGGTTCAQGVTEAGETPTPMANVTAPCAKRARRSEGEGMVGDDVEVMDVAAALEGCVDVGARVAGMQGSHSPATIQPASPHRHPHVHNMVHFPEHSGGSPPVVHHAWVAPQQDVTATLSRMGVTALRTIRVQHCFKAYALRMDLHGPSPLPATVSTPLRHDAEGGGLSGRTASLLYSGDTRPCEEVVALGRGDVVPTDAAQWLVGDTSPPGGCDLLIHEATFEDSMDGRSNAQAKNHSTVAEAVAVGQAMPATHLLLTHFSARYPKVPVLKLPASAADEAEGNGAHAPCDDDVDMAKGVSNPPMQAALRASTTPATEPSVEGGEAVEAAAERHGRTIFVAYDLMTVHSTRLPHLPKLLPALHLLFTEEEEGEEG